MSGYNNILTTTPVLSFDERMLNWENSEVINTRPITPPADGPIRLFFSPHGTFHGARNGEIYAAGAVLVQKDQVLASFSGYAEYEVNLIKLEYPTHRKLEKFDVLEKVPPLRDVNELNRAFGDFLLHAWSIVWNCFNPFIGDEKFKNMFDVAELGLFDIVSQGIFPSMEEHFLHRCVPEVREFEALFENEITSVAYGVHPCQHHQMPALLQAMGYQPTAFDQNKLAKIFGTSFKSRTPVETAHLMASAMRVFERQEPQFDQFKIPTFG